MPDSSDLRLLASAGTACLAQADAPQQTLVRVHSAAAPSTAPASADERALLTMVRSQTRHKIWGECALGLLNMGVHVADHVRALGMLLAHVREQGAPVYAHATLARGAVESVAWLWWLLADGERFEARFGRGIAFLIEDAGLAAKAADQVPGTAYLPPPGAQEQARQQALLARLDDARIERIMDRPGTRVKMIRVVRSGAGYSTSVKVSTLIPQAFPSMPALYDLISGVAHARQWGLMDHVSVSGGGRIASWRADPVAVSHSALICLQAAQRAGRLFADYRGHPQHLTVQQMQQRHDGFDRQMVRFGRSAGYFEHIRPVDGLLTNR
ncbi:hypothetical protein [Plantactinospora endophytica]|uniref:hypothetical protein n=1 Tax=Plantactinospora endophytica TaxID=673535 RepID=UPI0019431A78|nr:hypothetical protein [Plantactinospora endophytica]